MRAAHALRVIPRLLPAAVLHANASPSPRQIGAFYFNGPDQSQVWVDLDPVPDGGGAPPVRVNVTIRFRGHELHDAPKTATIRVTSNRLAAPQKIRLPILTFRLADDTVIDLTSGPAAGSPFVARCDQVA